MVQCNKDDIDKSCKSFKITSSNIGYSSPPTSYYKGKDPSSTAKKFGTMLFKLINDKNDPKYYKFNHQNTITFIIRETTRNSNNKTFSYITKRETLNKPIKRTLPNGTVITNKYKITVHKYDSNKTKTKPIINDSPLPTNEKKETFFLKPIIVENIKIDRDYFLPT